MVQRSGQMGVPVITVDNDVILGFDQPRLERLLGSSGSSQKRLGAAVAPASGGLLVGKVHFDSLAARAGLRPGDILHTVNGATVTTADELQSRLTASLRQQQPVRLGVLRDGKDLALQLTPPY